MERVAAGVALVLLVGFLLVVGLIRQPDEGPTALPDDGTVVSVESTTASSSATAAADQAEPTTTATVPTTTLPELQIVAAPSMVGWSRPAEWYHALVAVSADEVWLTLESVGGTMSIGHLAGGAGTRYRFTGDGGRVLGLARSPDGTVWAAADAGVFSFDGDRWVRRFDGSAGGVAVGPDGTVWIGGMREADTWEQDRLWLARGDGASWERLDADPDIPPTSPGRTPLAVAADGVVWMGHRIGVWVEDDLMRYDGASLAAVEAGGIPDPTPDNGMPAVGVFTIAAAPGGGVWVVGHLAAEPGRIVVAFYDGEAWASFEWPFEEPSGVAGDVGAAVGPDGVIWFAADGGLRSFDGTTWRSYLEGEWLFDVAVAPDGAVWYTDGDGAHVLTSP